MAGVVKTLQLPDVDDVVGATSAAAPWIDAADLRRRAGEHLQTGLTRELWKYTPIKGFLEALADSAADAGASVRHADQPGVRAVPLQALSPDEHAHIRRLTADQLNPDRHPLADLALLRAGGGWLVHVTAVAETPIDIHYPPRGVVPVFIVLEPNAALTVVEHGRQDGFLAQVTHVVVGEGARFTLHRTALDRDVAHYSLHSVHVDKDASVQLHQSCAGGQRRRSEVHVVLGAPGAHAELAGAYLVEDGQHLDQQLLVEHRAGHTTSRQKFHGIGAGKGRSVFNGRIHIHRDAPGSDARLSNKNLALSRDAEMNTKPELEIYTDDVRCAHGATVGQLSDEALFYLTARGIPAAEAKKLLAHGFVRECMVPPLAESAAARFAEALT